jgi:hypothetical protein
MYPVRIGYMLHVDGSGVGGTAADLILGALHAAGGEWSPACRKRLAVSADTHHLYDTILDWNISMTSSDAFALKNSGLNPFLFAEVGTELNGSPLTILSVLARLGQDPWAEAAKWTKLPKAAMIDRLAQSIAQMPLSPQAIGEARTTASRLILLLPSQVARPSETPAVSKMALPKWVLVAVCCAAVALGLAFTMRPGSTPPNTMAPISDLPAGNPPASAK